MLLAKIQDNEVLQIADSRELFPNISFGNGIVPEEFMLENNCMSVEMYRQYEGLTEKLESCAAYIENGKVYTVKVVLITDEERALSIRKQRNQLLLESDWTQLLDSPLNKEEWASYRQTLRDISLQETFPLSVDFPVKPS